MESIIWKEVINYPNYYISNNGLLKKVFKNGVTLIKSYHVHKNKYKRVNLSNSEGVKYFSLHRLVANAFISNPMNKGDVNHIDGDKLNNHADNLEWVTRKENIKHSWYMGLQQNMLDAHRKIVINCENGIFYDSCIEASKTYGISQPRLSHMLIEKAKNKTYLKYA
jgi:hypothetical protein